MTAEMSSSIVDQAVHMDSATLQEQIQRLVSLRLPGCGVHAPCRESLDKRRRKWRKRHKSSTSVMSTPKTDDTASNKEAMESLLSSFWKVQRELAVTRREGLDTVSHLRAEKWEHCLLAINYRLCHSKLSLESLQHTQPPHVPSIMTPHDLNQHQTIQDLQAVLDRARSLKTVEIMKFAETPRVPTIISQPSPILPITPVLSPLSQDSLELDIISLPQTIETTLDCNNNISAMVTTEVFTTLPIESPPAPISMPVSFMPTNPSITPMGDFTRTSDTDTSPMVGMEVVCGAGDEFAIDNDVVVASSHSISLPTPPLLPAETANTENMPVAKKPHTENTPVATKKPRTEKTPVATKKPRTENTPVATKKPRTEKTPVATKKPRTEETPVATKKPRTEKTPVASKKTRTEKTPVAKKPPSPSSTKTRRRSKKSTTPQRRRSKRLSKSPNPSMPKNGIKTEIVSDTDSDSDSQMRKMLEVLERAPYYLRVPQTTLGEKFRYSFQNGVSLTKDIKKKRRSSTTL